MSAINIKNTAGLRGQVVGQATIAIVGQTGVGLTHHGYDIIL